MQRVMLHAWVIVAACLAWTAPAGAAGRHKEERRLTMPPLAFGPAASAPAALDAPVLSGLDFTAIAPPGVRLRVIEDEPYTYAVVKHNGALSLVEGVTQLTLHSDLALSEQNGAGYYEARISLRAVPLSAASTLQDSFDAAADAAYTRSLLTGELRGATAIGIHEVRSPLGLTDPRDHANVAREYLAYSAAALNPNNPAAAGRATPYQYLKGELRLVRRGAGVLCLLCISFEAAEYPHALALTENLARCTVNRLDPKAKIQQRLNYLAYYPEFETATLDPGETLDPRISDLAERPGEGAGLKPQPIQGDRCPVCPAGEICWPARPYADAQYARLLGARITNAVCSHCLMESAAGYTATLEQDKQRKKAEKAKLKQQHKRDKQPKQPPSKDAKQCQDCPRRDAAAPCEPAGADQHDGPQQAVGNNAERPSQQG